MKSLRSFTIALTLFAASIWDVQHALGRSGPLEEGQTAARFSTQSAAFAQADPADTPPPTRPDGSAETAAAADDDKPDSEAQQTLRRARDRLRSSAPMQAEMREVVHIGQRRLKAAGRYIQGENLKLRLELKVSTDVGKGLGGSVLQVCDGQVLWTRHNVADNQRITRRDVGQILKAAQEHGAIERNVLVAELGLGGLPALLASIEESMTFDTVRDETIAGHALRVVEGTWSKKVRERLKQPEEESDSLPPHVPDSVRIYLDENDFPHRIVYLKRDGKRPQPMVTLGFQWLDEPIDEKAFNFVPPDGVIPVELTKAYIDRLTRPSAQESAHEPASQPATNPPQ